MELQDAITPICAAIGRPEHWHKVSRFGLKPAPGTADLFRAVEMSVDDDTTRLAVYRRLSETARALFPDRFQHTFKTRYDHIIDVHDFNNHRLTTHGDILRLLEAVTRSEQ